MKKCYPIRVPNCRTVTDIKRRTFQVSHLKLILGGPGGSGGPGGAGGPRGPGGSGGPENKIILQVLDPRAANYS